MMIVLAIGVACMFVGTAIFVSAGAYSFAIFPSGSGILQAALLIGIWRTRSQLEHENKE